MKNKFMAAACAALMILICIPVHAATGVINSFIVDATGKAEVSGYFDDTDYTDCALLMTEGSDTSDLTADKIMYIDQLPLGNNGTYLFRFMIDEKWSEADYTLRLNGGTMLTQAGTLRTIPDKMHNVCDNSIRVGNDIYSLSSLEYMPNKVSESLSRGGNKVYYKIGGMWFNMLDSKATGNDYFTLGNAIPESEWSNWTIDNYY